MGPLYGISVPDRVPRICGIRIGARRAMIGVMVVLVFSTCIAATSGAQEPASPPASAGHVDPSAAAEERPSAWDLTRFLANDDPLEAARLLRQHVAENGMSLEALEPSYNSDHGENGHGKGSTRAEGTLVHCFNGTEFRPVPGVEGGLAARASALVESDNPEEQLTCIIQFQGAMSLGDVVSVLEAGARVYDRVGGRSYIVRLPAKSVDLVRSRPFVRWIGDYGSEYKYVSSPSKSRMPGAYVYPLGGDKADYRADLARMGIDVVSYSAVTGTYYVILDTSRLRDVAGLWWVRGISKEGERMPLGLNFEPDDSKQMVSAFDTGHSGGGVDVGVYDSGLWPGNSLDFPSGSHGCNGTCTETDYWGHGTHVCGIIAARGGRDIEGTYDARGVAPGAGLRVAFLNYDSEQEAFDYFEDQDVRVSNHSWGYTSDDWCQYPPCFVYDYDENTAFMDAQADNADKLLVFAAGNEANARTITNPATGKNVISVGALRFATDDSLSGRVIGGRTSYSSQGPTRDDSRLKPDLVAPGGDTYQGYGYFKYGVVSTNNSGVVDDSLDDWPSSPWYTRMSGTSMAAPHATGVLADLNGAHLGYPLYPSELMKAILVNTAIPIKENSTDCLSAYANTQVGYGLVNTVGIDSTCFGEFQRVLCTYGTVNESTNQEDSWTITLPWFTRRVCVTLAYNDQEGEESDSKALIDDLDLIVEGPPPYYYWADDHLAPGVTTESPIEKMILTSGVYGGDQWTIRVRFTGSPGFGDPLTFASQRYGIVVDALGFSPELGLTIPQQSVSVCTNQPFVVQPKVVNSWGGVAVGVTLKIEGPSGFGGEINTTRYLRNLVHTDDSVRTSIPLVAPAAPGVYDLTVEADGVNQEFSTGYPKTRHVTVTVTEPEVTIYANYFGPGYPNGFQDSLARNVAPVIIDGATVNTPFTISASDLLVDVPQTATLLRDQSTFGKGVFACWSDGGAPSHVVVPTGDTTLVLGYNPFVLNVPGCGGVAAAVEDWADTGDTVKVGPGSYDLAGSPIVIGRPVTLISDEGLESTALVCHGSGPCISCSTAGDFTIGDEGKGFTFVGDSLDVAVSAFGCDDFVVRGNWFDMQPCGNSYAGIQAERCRGFLVRDNLFHAGCRGLDAKYDTSFTVSYNTFGNYGTEEWGPKTGIYLDFSDSVGVYHNLFYHNSFYAIRVNGIVSISSLEIGGSMETGNVFSNTGFINIHGYGPSTSRINAEYNYWNGYGWNEIRNAMWGIDAYRLDFGPWANWDHTVAFVPFDPQLCTLEATPSHGVVCPAGDRDTLRVTVAVLDSTGTPVEGMWADNVDLTWLRDKYADPVPCTTEVFFDEVVTDAYGRAGVNWSHMGGCDNQLTASVADSGLSDTVEVVVTSYDFTGDNKVTGPDLSAFATIYGTDELCGDYDGDGGVDALDLSEFGQHYGDFCVEVGSGGPGEIEGTISAEAESMPGIVLGLDREEASVGETEDFAVVVDGLKDVSPLAVEILVSYDAARTRLAGWNGTLGLSFCRPEPSPAGALTAGRVRVVSLIDGPLGVGGGESVVGCLAFGEIGGSGSIALPEIELVKGFDAAGSEIALAGRVVPAASRGDDGGGKSASAATLGLMPNPARGAVSITFGAPVLAGKYLSADVYDVRGRRVCSLYGGANDGLCHTRTVGLTEGARVQSPGVYFVRLRIDGEVLKTQKLVLLE
jgi:hypothetical protein